MLIFKKLTFGKRYLNSKYVINPIDEKKYL